MYYLAYTYGRLGKKKRARGLLRKVLVLDPGHEDAAAALAFLAN